MPESAPRSLIRDTETTLRVANAPEFAGISSPSLKYCKNKDLLAGAEGSRTSASGICVPLALLLSCLEESGGSCMRLLGSGARSAATLHRTIAVGPIGHDVRMGLLDEPDHLQLF